MRDKRRGFKRDFAQQDAVIKAEKTHFGMELLKKDAITMIAKLPDGANIEEIMSQLYGHNSRKPSNVSPLLGGTSNANDALHFVQHIL